MQCIAIVHYNSVIDICSQQAYITEILLPAYWIDIMNNEFDEYIVHLSMKFRQLINILGPSKFNVEGTYIFSLKIFLTDCVR